MGKKSKKKEQSAQEQMGEKADAQAVKKTKAEKAKKQAIKVEIREPKESEPVIAASAVEKKEERKITETADTSEEKQPPQRRLATPLKDFVDEQYRSFVDSLDPDKLSAFAKETKKILKGGAYFLAGTVSIVAILMVIEAHSQGRVMPNIKAGTVEVGYLKQDEARQKIIGALNAYLDTPLFFAYEGNTIEIPAKELGIRINMDQTINKIPVFDMKRDGALDLVIGAFKKQQIEVNYSLDGDAILYSLEERLHIKDVRAQNARFVLNGDELQVQPEKKGIMIDREGLIASLRRNIDGLSTSPINVKTVEEQPVIASAELEKEKGALMALLNKTITLTHDDDKMRIKLIDHLDAVKFGEKNAIHFTNLNMALPLIMTDGQVAQAKSNDVEVASHIQIELDENKLEPLLEEELIKDIEIPSSPANIYKNESGNVVIEGKGEDGKTVPRHQLLEAIELAANFGVEEVPVPVITEHAPITISDDLKELGINGLLATGHSAYYGSPPNRMFNISHGINKYNGVLIAPGEEFSFNALLGEVDAASGFKPEKVIKKDKLELEYGGGICQVSTTMYRAALLAGLPITDRKPHSWKVSYYAQSMGNGLDATIYPGVADLKFLNDTPGYLLVQAYDDGPEAYFKFYGTDDGRSVQMDGPYGGGLTYRWNRTVTKDGKAETEEIWSRYKPIPAPEPPKPAPAPVQNSF